MRQQRRINEIPPVSPTTSPDILPPELRPSIEDLDPDTKPVFVNRFV